MNTAQARSKAFDAEQARQYALAADLYQTALDLYPAHHAGAQIAIADKKGLELLVKQNRSAARQQAAGEILAAA